MTIFPKHVNRCSKSARRDVVVTSKKRVCRFQFPFYLLNLLRLTFFLYLFLFPCQYVVLFSLFACQFGHFPFQKWADPGLFCLFSFHANDILRHTLAGFELLSSEYTVGSLSSTPNWLCLCVFVIGNSRWPPGRFKPETSKLPLCTLRQSQCPLSLFVFVHLSSLLLPFVWLCSFHLNVRLQE